MTIIGTCHFVSLASARNYYVRQGFCSYVDAAAAVRAKLEAGEIYLGKPTLKPGQTLTTIDNGDRYAIEEQGA